MTASIFDFIIGKNGKTSEAIKQLNDTGEMLKQQTKKNMERQKRFQKFQDAMDKDFDALMECIDGSLGTDKPPD